jgi:hypothetical protein
VRLAVVQARRQTSDTTCNVFSKFSG